MATGEMLYLALVITAVLVFGLATVYAASTAPKH